jgi:predicted DNA-binding transcriptional regulator AlpA
MPNKSQPIQRTDGICREAERRVITGVPTSSWYLLQEKGLAPRPVRLGGPRAVGWDRQSLFRWVEERLAEDAWQQLGQVARRVIDKVHP